MARWSSPTCVARPVVVRARSALLVLALVACGARPSATPRGSSERGHEVMLYRDRAIVRQRIEIDVPASGIAKVRVRVARGLEADDIFVLDRGALQVSSIRVVGALARDPEADDNEPDENEPDESEADQSELDEGEPDKDAVEDTVIEELPGASTPALPHEIDIVVTSARTGKAAVSIGYVTPDLRWTAAYTLLTTPARDRATLRGAIAIHNATGLALPAARLRVVDADLGAEPSRSRKRLAAGFSAPGASGRDLGQVDLVDGEIRVPLVDGVSRTIRTALVFDPIGTRLDRKADAPDRDPSLGARAASARVTESYEIPRDARTRGLPGGAARMLERARDGSLSLVAEARLFDASTRDAPIDAFTLGTATGVTGHRERREITIDPRGNVAEDFVLTIDNARARPIEIVLREHLYRGQNWVLAYYSAPAEKEGAQQIVMRTHVPARGKATVMYVVVYTTPLR